MIDLGEDLHRSRKQIGNEILNRILTKMQKLGTKIEDYAVRHWITYSPLIDTHDIEILTDPDVEETEIGEFGNSYGMTKLIPTTAYPYDGVHSTVGAGSFTFPFTGKKFGAGAQTDGTINIKIDHYADFNVTDKISFGGFFYLKAFTGAEQVVFVKDQQYKLVINANSNTLEASVYISGSWGTAVTYAFTPNTWADVWVCWNGTNLKLYINGTLQDTESRSGTLNTTTNAIGLLGTAAGGSRCASGTKFAWFSVLHEDVSNITDWLTKHNTGTLITEGASEIVTIDGMDKITPTPNATLGLCMCG